MLFIVPDQVALGIYCNSGFIGAACLGFCMEEPSSVKCMLFTLYVNPYSPIPCVQTSCFKWLLCTQFVERRHPALNQLYD